MAKALARTAAKTPAKAAASKAPVKSTPKKAAKEKGGCCGGDCDCGPEGCGDNCTCGPDGCGSGGCGENGGGCCGGGGCGDSKYACEVELRQFRTEDYKQLRQVWLQSDIELDETDSAGAIEKALKAAGGRYRIFVAQAQVIDTEAKKPAGKPKIIGGVVVTFDGRRCWVYHLAVDPQYRNVGVGRALLELCERQAKLWGSKRLRLLVKLDPNSVPAQRLYIAGGWQPNKEVRLFSKDVGGKTSC